MPQDRRRPRRVVTIPLAAATIAVLAATLAAPAAAAGGRAGVLQDRSFTLEDVLAAAFPTELTAAADGSAVAWVLNEDGARNVWIARAPELVGRRLTGYERDDGQEIGDLQFAAGGRLLVFVRGGAPNRAGELPNPRSDAEGVERAIFAISTSAGGTPWKIAEGTSPLVSPDGSELLFSRRGELRLLPLDEELLARPATDGERALPESRAVLTARGGIGSARFSPDGRRIAFVSNRRTHSFVGVADLDGEGPVTWIDPSVDTDRSPVWSPDGSHVAFVRVPASHRLVIFAPERRARPWSIRVADPATGRSQVVFTAEEGSGSVPQGIATPSTPHESGLLTWSADGRLVFPWERNGWKGLYSIAAGGGEPVAVAVGRFEVEQAVLARGGRQLLVVSNQDDIDRRHLWRVPADGSSPATRVGSGDWIEWSPTPLADGRLAYLRSGATVPAHAVVRTDDGEVRGLADAAIPDRFPGDSLVSPQPVVFAAADGLPIHGQLFLPAGAAPGERHPAVLFFHGGSRRQMLLGFHYLDYYHNAYAFNQYLASRGYVVLAVNYRSGVGYGMEFREALGYGASGASEFNDVLGAGLYLRNRDDVDAERIGLWGGSYGGYLTAMGLARASHLFAAGVDLHGVHDWNEGIRIFVPDYDPDPDTERLAFESSPNASLDTWRSPVLLIHGDDDRNVFFSQSVYLVEALRDRDVHVEQLVFPDEVHGFLLHRSWLAAYRAAADFFERML